DLGEAGLVERPADMPDRRRRDAGADEVAQLRLGAIAADRLRRVALQHIIGFGEIEPLDIAPAMGVDPDREAPRRREIGEAPADIERIAYLAAEIIDQHA